MLRVQFITVVDGSVIMHWHLRSQDTGDAADAVHHGGLRPCDRPRSQDSRCGHVTRVISRQPVDPLHRHCGG